MALANIKANRTLAIQVSPHVGVGITFRVTKYLRLEEGYAPDGITEGEWKKILDHWDNDGSTALQRGVFYVVGDIITVDRFEAADLLTIVPTFFDPADERAILMARTIETGEVPS